MRVKPTQDLQQGRLATLRAIADNPIKPIEFFACPNR
jgi:hypothetical protein